MKLFFLALVSSLLSSSVVARRAESMSSKKGGYGYGGGCTVDEYEFNWRGQFAGFIVNGHFSYDTSEVPSGGIVREEDLLSLEVSFYNPQGTLLRTYADNHKDEYVNIAFDHLSQELLQDGTWKVDDDELRYRNGFMMGEGSPDMRKENGVQSGLAFWSRPADNKTPHLHVDDWNDENGDGEFEFPIGYSSHEDASFLYKTTQQNIDGGKVGKAYYDMDEDGEVTVNKLASDVGAFGQSVRVTRVATGKCSSKGGKKGYGYKKGYAKRGYGGSSSSSTSASASSSTSASVSSSMSSSASSSMSASADGDGASADGDGRRTRRRN